MTAVLFIGPSVPAEVVRAEFSGEIRPPIKRGDLPELLARPEPPRHIGIVDGQFLHTLAVAPKEVLRCLLSGVSVYGSSSMGALRATECHPYGMVGIGEIFRMYRDEELFADDEVAITFSPDTLRPYSEPMVNIRVAIRSALDQGVVGRPVADEIISIAERMYFPDRNYSNLRLASKGRIADDDHGRLFAFLNGPEAPDQKRSDAMELIRLMNSAVEADQGDDAANPEEGGS